MGTNLFVEGYPAPVVIAVRLSRSADSFQDVASVARALADIDLLLRRDWSKTWDSFRERRQRDVSLLGFRVASPPEFKILADPAWLAVFITILVNYKDGKASLREMHSDAMSLVTAVRGLTERQMQLLDIAVRLTLERWASSGEAKAILIAKRLRRARQALMGSSESMPDIEVRDVDNQYRLW